MDNTTEDPGVDEVTVEDDVLAKRAEDLVEHWLGDESARTRPRELRRTRRVGRLLEDPEDLSFVLALTDEVLRIRDPKRAARHFRELVRSSGIPRFMGSLDRVSVGIGSFLSGLFPRVVMPLVLTRVRAELSGYVVPAEPSRLARHIARRRDQGMRLNINVLGGPCWVTTRHGTVWRLSSHCCNGATLPTFQ